MKCFKVKCEGDEILILCSDNIDSFEKAQQYAKKLGRVPKNIEEYKHFVLTRYYREWAELEKFKREPMMFECK